MLAVALSVAVLSLLVARTPTYDVWAWLVWGREIAHLDLDAHNGPAWKPLPIAVATLLSPAGGAVPALWLVIARTAGLLALGGAARLAYRVAGPIAAAGAATSLITANLWVGYLLPYGMSEPMLAAFVLWAAERHLQGRLTQAWWLMVAAALLRPEVWPFLILYAGWLAWRRAVHPAVLAAGLVLIPLAWFVPQGVGGGNPFRLGQGQAAPDGPLEQGHPGLAALEQVPSLLMPWAEAGVVAALAWAVVARDRLLLAVATGGIAWAALVAAMAELHLGSGISRYLVVTQAGAAVLAGVGWAHLIRWAHAQLVHRRAKAGVAIGVPVLVTLAVAAASAPSFAAGNRPLAHEVRYQQSLAKALPKAVTASGGRNALLSCGRPWVDPLQVTVTAWQLRLHISKVRAIAVPGSPPESYRGPILQTRNRLDDPVSPLPFDLFAWHESGRGSVGGATWTVLSPCPGF